MTIHRAIVGIMACLLLFPGCRKDHSSNDTDKVDLRLKWLVQVHSAGAILADSKGYFEKQGLECTIKPGGPDYDSIKLVAAGQDDYGVTSADQLILARSKGMPIVAIGVLFQKSPVCFFAKKTVDLAVPQDFVGKTVGVKYGTNAETEYQVLMKRAGIDRGSINEVPVKFDLGPFLAGKVDVWPGLESNEPLLVQQKGISVNVMLSRDHGIATYSNVYFTTEERLQQHPQQVTGFMKAVRSAWIYARTHQDEAVKAVLAVNEQLDSVHERKALELTLPIIFPDGGTTSFGLMTEEGWKQTQSVLLDAGLLQEPIDIRAAYRNVLY